jgi:hypothetical protein
MGLGLFDLGADGLALGGAAGQWSGASSAANSGVGHEACDGQQGKGGRNFMWKLQVAIGRQDEFCRCSGPARLQTVDSGHA